MNINKMETQNKDKTENLSLSMKWVLVFRSHIGIEYRYFCVINVNIVYWRRHLINYEWASVNPLN